MESFLYDDDEHISGDCDPDLGFHSILRCPEEAFDTKMLFDPFEEQFDLPPTFVERTDAQRRQERVVGEKDESLAAFCILEANAPQVLGVMPMTMETIQQYALVADEDGQ